jgi:hypothetical protein
MREVDHEDNMIDICIMHHDTQWTKPHHCQQDNMVPHIHTVLGDWVEEEILMADLEQVTVAVKSRASRSWVLMTLK